MARQLNKLTAMQVNKLTKKGLYADGGNLYLQITTTGAKSWSFRYMIEGKASTMGLGPLHTVSLAEARLKAHEARKLLSDGINPLAHKKQMKTEQALSASKQMTFDWCANSYIHAHKAGWKNAKHIKQWENTLNNYASPVFGSMPVSAVDTPLIINCLEPIWVNKNETARRLRGRIESVLDWAKTSGYRSGENPARWKGHIENLLPSLKKSKNVAHFPSLPWQQAPAFMKKLRSMQGDSARALEFLILTACRSGDARGARWAEIDIDNKIWTIPANRIKMTKEHQVPLSKSTLNLLGNRPKENELVFPNALGNELSDVSLTKVIKKMCIPEEHLWEDINGKRITVHGFRSTFRMWGAENTDHPDDALEQALAHQIKNPVERAYQRGSQLTKRVVIMDDWDSFCTSHCSQ